MKKFILSASLVAMAVLSGCGGSSDCCKADIATKANDIPPVAVITGLKDKTVLALGQSVTVDGIGSSDRDGTVVGYKWMLDGKEVSTEQKPTITFNTPGNHELCLTVTDNDNNPSVNQECRTVTVLGKNSNVPVAPTAIITFSDKDNLADYTLHNFSCEKSHDNDTLGSGAEIQKCEWDIQSYTLNDKGVEVPYRSCTSEAMSGKPVYICPEAVKIVAKLTVTDNDGQTHSTTEVYYPNR